MLQCNNWINVGSSRLEIDLQYGYSGYQPFVLTVDTVLILLQHQSTAK